MKNTYAAIGIVASIAVTACTTSSTIHSYRVTDIQSRREYIAVGQPTFLSGGAISFTDRDSAKMVTLQDYEVSGIEGESYQVRQNIWTGQYELVKQNPQKK